MKSKQMEEFLEVMFKRTSKMTAGECVTCGKPIDGFRDALSEKEYAISGLCQTCQDLTFGGQEEDSLEAEAQVLGDMEEQEDQDE
jgi:hypothetical protein